MSLAARVTEVGTIELWCQSRTDDRRWRLQIQLRGPAGSWPPAAPVAGEETDRVVIEQSELDAAIAAIRAAFEPARGSPASPGDGRAGAIGQAARRGARRPPRPVASVGTASLGGSRSSNWPKAAQEPAARVALVQPRRVLPASRPWLSARRYPDQGPLADLSSRREAYQGRPVLGRVVDPLAAGGGGAERPHHEEIYRRLAPFLLPAKGASPAKKAGRPKPEPHELAEMWRCAASLERLGT